MGQIIKIGLMIDLGQGGFTGVPVIGYAAGEWIAHPCWQIPGYDDPPIKAWHITHIPTGRYLARAMRFYDAVIAVERLADMPRIMNATMHIVGVPTPKGTIPPGWLRKMGEALGDLPLWVQPGISITEYMRLVNEGMH